MLPDNNAESESNYDPCFQHLGSQDDIALKIKSDTHVKISAMNKQVATNKDKVRHYRHAIANGIVLDGKNSKNMI